jgi:CheY-like chemotaxis protein
MDLMMPGDIDGTEAIRILKSEGGTSCCKVVILTGREDAQTIQESMIAQADAWFLKPFSPLELLQRVEELLR